MTPITLIEPLLESWFAPGLGGGTEGIVAKLGEATHFSAQEGDDVQGLRVGEFRIDDAVSKGSPFAFAGSASRPPTREEASTVLNLFGRGPFAKVSRFITGRHVGPGYACPLAASRNCSSRFPPTRRRYQAVERVSSIGAISDSRASRARA